jgi:diguanylate cyclase (GGDEF)-like protein
LDDLQPTYPAPLADANDPVAILSALDSVVYDWDIVSDRIVWGPNAARTLAELPGEALATGAGYAGLVAAESDASRYHAVFNGLTFDEGEGAPFRVQYRLAAPGGAMLAVEDFGRWFADAEGRPRRVHGLLRVLNRAAPSPANVVPEDGLDQTLCSRRAFNAWVDQRCAEPRAPDCALALMVVGVGNVGEINAREGYDVGDELILGVGRRLAMSLRNGDKLVRYSGAKFALLVALAASDIPGIAAERLARRANAEFYPTSAGAQRAMTRVGVALSPRHGRTAHLLMQRADEALAQTSETGAAVAVYAANEALAETRRRDAWVGDEIVAALNDRRVFLAYQPIAPTDARLPPFEEALVRLRLEDGMTLGPEAVIPAAERLGLIELIDARVLELAVARLAAEPSCRLSMNASLAALRSPDWFERLRDRLARAPGAAGRLIVEIVETQAVENVAEVASALARIKALGVRVAMDDFGAGHTSFRNLRSLGVDMVKIDGAFVAGLANSVDDRFFVRTLASLARHLGILTVAEWVEDADSARLLRDWGVDYLQGHFIGRAEEPEAQAALEAARVRPISSR